MRQPTSSEWALIQDSFDNLADKPAAARARALKRLKLDAFVFERVEAMLATHDETGFLDARRPAPPAGDDAPVDYSSLKDGASVGAFRIERLIGRGGTGEVYLAKRVQGGFDQDVALKLLRPESAGQAVLFDRERQTLAGLEHPGISRLIDGGIAPDGRPFMAMEYVDGEPITRWCDSHAATLAQRLALFLEVCDAVTYAHARLVIHRDLKPANILVDSAGRVRLLDFGVARLLIDNAQTQLGQTQAAHTSAGMTPDYAAPEQLRQEAPTVATDIYALGGLLYELLSGQGAWRGSGGSLPSSLNRMLEEVPQLPSQAAARLQGESLSPPVPPARIAGDLDAIVMKAMRHAPADRYASVPSLADDVRRYLAFEPVQTRTGNLGYHVRRFVRRHRWATAATAAGMLAVLTGAAGIGWQAHQTAIERDIARAEARKAQAVNTALTLMFRNAQDFGAGGSATAHDLLNDSAKRLIASFDTRSGNTADIVLSLSELYVDIGDTAGAETLLDEALKKGVAGTDPIARARLEMTLGTVEAAQNKMDDAQRLLDRTDRVWQTDPARYRKERLESVGARAQMLRLQGKRDQAVKLLTDSLPEAEIQYADSPRDLLIAYNNLAVHLIELNRLDDLDPLLKRADTLEVRARLTQTPVALSMMQVRAGLYSRRNDQVKALQTMEGIVALRRAIYGASLPLATDLMQEGVLMLGTGKIREAVPVLTEAQQLARVYSSPTSQYSVMIGIQLGEAYAYLGDAAGARREFAAIAPVVSAPASQPLLYGIFLRGRFELGMAEHDYARAEADIDAAEAVFKKVGPSGDTFLQSLPGLRKRLVAARAKGGKA